MFFKKIEIAVFIEWNFEIISNNFNWFYCSFYCCFGHVNFIKIFCAANYYHFDIITIYSATALDTALEYFFIILSCKSTESTSFSISLSNMAHISWFAFCLAKT